MSRKTGKPSYVRHAAAQLDQINMDAGFGHQHVYLQTEQGSGAFTPDGEEEGHTGG